ncbi:hypothetical protein HNR19_000272 [Nocardioides thalensis]|uniref:Uncharacterized protein n=1 Tax=Nocardioides thalensis TaxID=1914755 RepID=A0A853BWX6_9ACTN|nr:hypothetical protein [Nocardioides thalensis]NYI99573.1 hypothetical protein [Nocardioides thalensis]
MASTHAPGTAHYATDRRISTETKASFKTTEFVFYILAVIGLLIASAVADSGSDFGTQEVWFYITLLTIGYMVSRGLAKSGSREHFDDSTGANSGRGHDHR